MSEAIQSETRWFETEDGARLALRHRWSRRAGPPVMFFHGLAVNSSLWDMPDLDLPDLRYQSLSTVLAERGHDVWLVNFRGHGPRPSRSQPAPGQADYCVDHFIHYDWPAAVQGVLKATGHTPHVIAASLGAMVTAAHLSGASLRREGGADALIVADPEEARRRQSLVRSAILFDFPAALRWPASLYDADGRLRWDQLAQAKYGSDRNYAYELLSRAPWLEVILDAVGEIRLDWVHPRPGWTERRNKYPAPIRRLLDTWEAAFSRGFAAVANAWKGSDGMRPELFRHGIRYAADHVKSGVLRQLAKGVRARSFVSALGAPDHDYTSGYSNIALPVMLVQGGRDNIANAEVTRAEFFDRIASKNKRISVYPEYAHGDSEYSATAPQRVYPEVLDWLAAADVAKVGASSEK